MEDCLFLQELEKGQREGNDLLREMLESGIIKYGDDFLKSMEEGGWDLKRLISQL